MITGPDPDARELRARLTRLLEGLRASGDHNPATVEALQRAFPELAPTPASATRRPVLARIKNWFAPRKAA